MRALSCRFAPALVALVLATPALADLTAPQVWALWQDAGDATGLRLTSTRESTAGGALSLFDVALALDLGQGTVSGTIPRIDLTEQGDGTVAITLSPRHDMHLRLADKTGETLDASLAVDLPGLRLIASGDARRQSYDIDAPRIAVTLDKALINDAPIDVQMSLALHDLSGRSSVSAGTQDTFDSTLTANSVEFDAQGRMPGAAGRAIALTGTYGPLNAEITGGARPTSTLSHGAGKLAVTVDQPDYVPFEWTSTSKAGRLTTSLSDGMIDQTGRITGTAFSAKGSILPVADLKAQMDVADWSLRMPATPSDTPRDLALQLDIDGVTLDENLWAAFDPDGTFPREAASLHLDVTGQGRLLEGHPSPLGKPLPGVFHSLVLNALRLSAAGADLTGTGALSFDPSMPAPDGTIDLTLKGSGAVLTKLVQLGLIPEGQMMGAQLILGLFTVPTGDDEVGTTLTFTPDGKISANGQRVQ